MADEQIHAGHRKRLLERFQTAGLRSFSDIEVLERRIAKNSRAAKNDKKIAAEVAFLNRIKDHLEGGRLGHHHLLGRPHRHQPRTV